MGEGGGVGFREREREPINGKQSIYVCACVHIATRVYTQYKRSHRPGAFVISDLPRDQYDVDFTVAAQPRPANGLGTPGFCRGRSVGPRRNVCTQVYTHAREPAEKEKT